MFERTRSQGYDSRAESSAHTIRDTSRSFHIVRLIYSENREKQLRVLCQGSSAAARDAEVALIDITLCKNNVCESPAVV